MLGQLPTVVACAVTACGLMYSAATSSMVLHREPQTLQVEEVYSQRTVADAQARFYLAATMWGEARAEGYSGMLAVGNVILNRIDADPERYGATIKEATLRRKQFSCWNADDPNRPLLKHSYLSGLDADSVDGQAWATALLLADALLLGRVQDTTDGATHYHARSVAPNWSLVQERLGAIGSHVFYRS